MERTPHDLLTAFDAAHRAKLELPAAITRGKDHKIAKELLETYAWVHIEGLIATFFEMRDPFIQQAGYSLGIFKACLPKVIAAWHRARDRAVPDDASQAMVLKIWERKQADTEAELAEQRAAWEAKKRQRGIA